MHWQHEPVAWIMRAIETSWRDVCVLPLARFSKLSKDALCSHAG